MNKTLKRIYKTLHLAKEMAYEKDKTLNYELGNWVSVIQIYSGYAEPGYEHLPFAIVGDWNLPIDSHAKRVEKILEKLAKKEGVELEWYDEWSSCDECARLLKLTADCWDWKPSYIREVNEEKNTFTFLCKDCYASRCVE